MEVMLRFSHPRLNRLSPMAERFAFTPIPGPSPVEGEGSGV